MSDRDRSNQERGFDDPARREARGAERQPGTSSNRGRPYPDDEESLDLPAWSETPSRTGPREQSSRSAAPKRPPSSEVEPRGSGRRDPIPELGEAFRRPGRPNQASPGEIPGPAANDPYDRLRHVASKPARPVEFDEEPFGDERYDDSRDRREAVPPIGDQRRRSAGRRSSTSSGRTGHAQRTPPAQQLGGIISAAAPQTRFIAAVLGIGLISLVFMAATVAGRMSSLPDWLPIHLNAEGTPDRWGTSSTLWRIPLMVLFLSLMSAAVAWAVGKRDPFAVKFTLASTLLVHALCWIALVNLAW